jgi:hypothetical protein
MILPIQKHSLQASRLAQRMALSLAARKRMR